MTPTDPVIRIRNGPAWPERCRPFAPRAGGQPLSLLPLPQIPKPSPSRSSDPGTGVITLHEAARRMGLLLRAKKSWTPFLLNLCSQKGIDVRRDPFGVPCMRLSDLPILERAVRAHQNRKLPWAARPCRKNLAVRPK
jgi:hypothetical protein